MKKNYLFIAAALFGALSIYSCKKELNPAKDSVVETAITPRYLNSIVLGAYTKLQPLATGVIEDAEATTDALIIPVRVGGDWLDGDEPLYSYGSILIYPGTARDWADWSTLYARRRADKHCHWPFTGFTGDQYFCILHCGIKSRYACYFYYVLLTEFGNVPYIISSNTNASTAPTVPAATVYQDLITELKADAPLLSSSTPAVDPSQYGRINKWGAYFLLAKLYMNQNWITGGSDNSGYTALLRLYCDSLMTSGYSLNS